MFETKTIRRCTRYDAGHDRNKEWSSGRTPKACTSNFTALYNEQRRWKEAEESEETRRRALGDEHLGDTDEYEQLGVHIQVQRLWKEAQKLAILANVSGMCTPRHSRL